MALPLAEQLVADALEKGSRFDRAYLAECAPQAVEIVKAIEASVPAPTESYVKLAEGMLDDYPLYVRYSFLSGRPLEEVVWDMCVGVSLTSQDAMVEGEPVPARCPPRTSIHIAHRLFPMIGRLQVAHEARFAAAFIRSFKSAISGHA